MNDDLLTRPANDELPLIPWGRVYAALVILWLFVGGALGGAIAYFQDARSQRLLGQAFLVYLLLALFLGAAYGAAKSHSPGNRWKAWVAGISAILLYML